MSEHLLTRGKLLMFMFFGQSDFDDVVVGRCEEKVETMVERVFFWGMSIHRESAWKKDVDRIKNRWMLFGPDLLGHILLF